MDHSNEVELFRSMLVQKGVVAPDGSEPILTTLLASDESAVSHFCSNYLLQPTGWEEKAIRSAYSALERNQMLSKDLMILTLWGQFIETNRMAMGYEYAVHLLHTFGFQAFRRLDYQDMREKVSSTRSIYSDHVCDLREALGRTDQRRSKKKGRLLEKKVVQ